ncbi:MAG: tetratricopeptide repeat protein [Solirubrobacterales bacterium]|nr:tetratricopeptide repeat protein [Solirubrobacterales bacterium]
MSKSSATYREVPLLIQETETQTSEQREGALGVLPVQLTRLVGRDTALGELRSLVWRTRVLTLCGPGGAGKTRLAIALAEAIRPDFVGGAWWVDLSTTLEPGLVGQVVAATVLRRELTSDPAPSALARGLPDSALLVLDNCEQVVDACADLVVGLLERSASLRVIATSRQPLGVPGERVWRVAGLAVDGADDPPDTDGYANDGAASLFVERAVEAQSTFDPDAPGVRESIGRICRWLDGMPLAIELAAARVPVLSVAQIADRLERDPSVLRHPGRRAPERHRTVDSMLEWSHRLLEPEEQRLFRRLGVFRGSFSLAAAEFVSAGYLLDAADVLDLLAVLIDRSLVQVVDHPRGPRYRLLATVRQYAAAKLWDGPEAPTVSWRHAEYFSALAATARTGLGGATQVKWLERLEADHDNVTEALAWLEAESIEEAARLAALLWPFWYRRGFYGEARMWFEQILSRAGELSAARRADIRLRAGSVAFLQCDYTEAAEHLRAALEIVGPLGDQRATAIALQRLGSIAREQARYDEASALHERSLATWRELGHAEGVAASQDYLGFVEWLRGNTEAAEAACAAALGEFTRVGNRQLGATALVNLGACALYRGDLSLAHERLERALADARAVGFQEGIAWSLHELAIATRRMRRPVSEYGPMLREALLVHQQLGDRWRLASVLEEIAGAVLVRHDPELAGEVLGAAEALRERLGTPIPPVEAPDRDAAVAQLARKLGAPRFDSARTEGRTRSLERTIDRTVEALDAVEGTAATPGEGGAAADLTPRELAVLELLSQGLTNREIASALYISPSTAGVHVSNILRKLGAKRRVDAAAAAHKLGLLGAR